jgi:hypothetical protein
MLSPKDDALAGAHFRDEYEILRIGIDGVAREQAAGAQAAHWGDDPRGGMARAKVLERLIIRPIFDNHYRPGI